MLRAMLLALSPACFSLDILFFAGWKTCHALSLTRSSVTLDDSSSRAPLIARVLSEKSMFRITTLSYMLGIAISTISVAAENTITFTKQSSQPGQKMVQRSMVHTACVQSYEQSNQVISTSDRDVSNTQVRNITTVSTSPPVVQVSYTEASLREGKNRLFAKKTSQPVENKSYRVSRNGEILKVVNQHGETPPPEETAIVEKTMSWVGRPNELAEFLNGQTLALQQRLVLPKNVAAKIFGGAVGMDTVQSATLALKQIKVIRGAKCGVFQVDLIGTVPEDGSAPLEVQGMLTVQADTCRTASAEVKSDLDVTEERGPTGGKFTVKNKGKVHIAIHAAFDEPLSKRQ